MPTHKPGFHHLNVRKRIYKKHEPYPHPDKSIRFFDKIIYLAAFMTPIMNIPQLMKVWILKDASGVSLVSWIAFPILSFLWVIYGIIHNEKPIIFMNILLVILQSTIALGAFLYG